MTSYQAIQAANVAIMVFRVATTVQCYQRQPHFQCRPSVITQNLTNYFSHIIQPSTCFGQLSASRYDRFAPHNGQFGDRILMEARSRQHRPRGATGLLSNGYLVSCQGVKWPGSGVNHPPLSSTEVKERVELHLYPFYRPSWQVTG